MSDQKLEAWPAEINAASWVSTIAELKQLPRFAKMDKKTTAKERDEDAEEEDEKYKQEVMETIKKCVPNIPFHEQKHIVSEEVLLGLEIMHVQSGVRVKLHSLMKVIPINNIWLCTTAPDASGNSHVVKLLDKQFSQSKSAPEVLRLLKKHNVNTHGFSTGWYWMGQPVLVMEKIQTVEYTDDGDIQMALDVLADLVPQLEQLHVDAGIIHGDIKPDNVGFRVLNPTTQKKNYFLFDWDEAKFDSLLMGKPGSGRLGRNHSIFSLNMPSSPVLWREDILETLISVAVIGYGFPESEEKNIRLAIQHRLPALFTKNTSGSGGGLGAGAAATGLETKSNHDVLAQRLWNCQVFVWSHWDTSVLPDRHWYRHLAALATGQESLLPSAFRLVARVPPPLHVLSNHPFTTGNDDDDDDDDDDDADTDDDKDNKKQPIVLHSKHGWQAKVTPQVQTSWKFTNVLQDLFIDLIGYHRSGKLFASGIHPEHDITFTKQGAFIKWHFFPPRNIELLRYNMLNMHTFGPYQALRYDHETEMKQIDKKYSPMLYINPYDTKNYVSRFYLPRNWIMDVLDLLHTLCFIFIYMTSQENKPVLEKLDTAPGEFVTQCINSSSSTYVLFDDDVKFREEQRAILKKQKGIVFVPDAIVLLFQIFHNTHKNQAQVPRPELVWPTAIEKQVFDIILSGE